MALRTRFIVEVGHHRSESFEYFRNIEAYMDRITDRAASRITAVEVWKFKVTK